jgi:hypothetical protein
MPYKKQVLIIESIPQGENPIEGKMIASLLDFALHGTYEMQIVANKSDLLDILDDRKYLRRFGYVHLSGHGEDDPPAFVLPRGSVTPQEFPEGCFRTRTVLLSACTLGKADFIEPFMHRTDPKAVIGPRREVPFIDSAVFFINFYYWASHRGVGVESAFNHAVNCGTKGDFWRFR